MTERNHLQAFRDPAWGPFEDCPNSPFLDMGSGPEWNEVLRQAEDRRQRQALGKAEARLDEGRLLSTAK